MESQKDYYYGTGRRKTAVAQVRLLAGKGNIIINGISFEEKFPRLEHRNTILRPLMVAEVMGKYNVMAKVSGGGVSGQSGAISHGIARALLRSNDGLRQVLRHNGLLTRDSRVKERKKPGLKRARKAPQYTKR
ncbi:30S ribosomal protein S9 [Chloroflexota bacterium]